MKSRALHYFLGLKRSCTTVYGCVSWLKTAMKAFEKRQAYLQCQLMTKQDACTCSYNRLHMIETCTLIDSALCVNVFALVHLRGVVRGLSPS